MKKGSSGDEPEETKSVAASSLAPELKAYREWLLETDRRVLESYDKAMMTLSGGALAISLTFINDIVTSPKPGTVALLVTAWSLLTLSVVAILASIFAAHIAHRKAIEQVDEGKIYKEKAGGWFACLTSWLNVGALMSFFFGVVFLAWFAISNMVHVENP